MSFSYSLFFLGISVGDHLQSFSIYLEVLLILIFLFSYELSLWKKLLFKVSNSVMSHVGYKITNLLWFVSIARILFLHARFRGPIFRLDVYGMFYLF